jgi:hypothetical protein
MKPVESIHRCDHCRQRATVLLLDRRGRVPKVAWVCAELEQTFLDACAEVGHRRVAFRIVARQKPLAVVSVPPAAETADRRRRPLIRKQA